MNMSDNKDLRIELLRKYDVPCPRYTSYPTVPYWDDPPSTDQWFSALNETFEESSTAYGIYIHIPYCETLCTYCGCNNSITKNHDKEDPYVARVLQEWELYKQAVPALVDAPLKQIHLGGGTPTFLSADNLEALLSPILSDASRVTEDFEGSIEVDPRRTNFDQLQRLRQLGFQRISMGVQDFDPVVQQLVRRIQPFEMTADITRMARELDYESINFDLIYGLPGQTLASIEKTTELTVRLMPDRIALYSLAIVPWIKPAQRSFSDDDLPTGHEKRALYDLSRERLLQAGYIEIGMDHFALESDALHKSLREGSLHRNFMGYTDQRTDVLIGLGVSSISECPSCFHQNEKVLSKYEDSLEKGEFPTLRGHQLSDSDRSHRQQILEFMTRFAVELIGPEQERDVREFLSAMIRDGLVEVGDGRMSMTDKGRPFLRNACMALDQRLRQGCPEEKVFSQAI